MASANSFRRHHPQTSGTRFANLSIYEEGTIDDPVNTVDAALAMGRLVGQNIGETPAGRPFFNSRARTDPQFQGQADHAA